MRTTPPTVFNLRGAGAPEIRDCRIEGNGENGIYQVNGNTAPLIVDNQILGNGDWGIRFDSGGSLSPPITGNTIRDNRLLAILPPRDVPAGGGQQHSGPEQRNALWIRGTSTDRVTDLQLSVLSSPSGAPAEEEFELRTYVISGRSGDGPGHDADGGSGRGGEVLGYRFDPADGWGR